MNTDASRTHHANQAIALSELVALKFAKLNLGGKTPRTLKISAPDGPSTGGGRQARQSLVLAPVNGKAPNIVCGFIDSAKGVAELRSFLVLDQQNRAHHGQPLDFMRVDYDKFVHDMVSFLHAQGLDARVSNEKLEKAGPTEASSSQSSNSTLQLAAMLIFGFMLGLGTGYIVFKLM